MMGHPIARVLMLCDTETHIRSQTRMGVRPPGNAFPGAGSTRNAFEYHAQAH
jgi:hypothetical protein